MNGQTSRLVTVSYNVTKGKTDRMWRKCVGSDRAIIHLRPEHQRDLKRVRKECGFEYLRFHGLLNEEMKVYREGAGGPVYDWSNIDAVYDLFLGIGMKPFVELGFMPEGLASGTKTIFWWKGNVTPPKSYEQWGSFIEALVMHLTQRYGRKEVQSWFFEVWNEPNLDGFWAGTQQDYFRLLESSARAIKKVDPNYLVGGPATAGCGWFPETIEFCARNNVPLDFIAGHHYGAMEGFLDEFGKQHTTLDPDPGALVNHILRNGEQIRASAMPHLPLHITEWSTSYSPRDPSHDSYHTCSYILQKLKKLEGHVASMSYWTFTDQFEEPGPVPSPFHGGFGLLNAQGLPKPAYFAYRFLSQLGDTELACDDADVWACRGDKGVQVLLYDFRMPQQDAPNKDYYIRDLPAKAIAPAKLVIRDLPAGEYRLTAVRVGYRNNDVYTAYLDMGRPAGLAGNPGYLPESTAAELERACSGAPVVDRKVSVVAGTPLEIELPLSEHDVYFVSLQR